MAVNNTDYQIKITTELDGKGLEKATGDVQALNKATTQANEPIKEAAVTDHFKTSQSGSNQNQPL
ncbi:MAG: hypothetical protein ACLQU4_00575 [Limisphaerales bacterium]